MSLGFYCIFDETDSFDDIDWIANWQPAIIKIHNSIRHANRAHKKAPNATIALRYDAIDNAIKAAWDKGLGGAAVAEEAWKVALPIARQVPFAVIIFSINEFGDWPQLARYGEFMKRAYELGTRDGVMVGSGSFSAEAKLWEPEPGMPWPKVSYIAVALSVCKKGKHKLLLHGYNAPTLEEADNDDFLYAYRHLIDRPDIIVDEVGIDLIKSKGALFPGWRTTGVTPEHYRDQLLRVRDQFRKDGVLGTIYVFTRKLNYGDDPTMYNIAVAGAKRQGEPAETPVADLLVTELKVTAPLPPVTPPPANTGDRVVVVIQGVNLRAQPLITSALLGTLNPGAPPITVTGQVTNGYVREKTYGWWILAANLKGV